MGAKSRKEGANSISIANNNAINATNFTRLGCDIEATSSTD
jgi:hypothetical protein